MGDLFVISRADIFAIYPKILAGILSAEDAKRAREGGLAKDFIHLPTDSDYQERVYYRLLAVQKNINDLLDSGVTLDEILAKKAKAQWDPECQFTISPQSSPASGFSLRRKKCIVDDPMDFLNVDELAQWNLYDLTMAAKLLRKPPILCTFNDEYEMRRVYSMIYDVFRYKHILSQALYDVQFFVNYPQLVNDKNRLWLLLYDLHLRHFLRREPKERVREKELYDESDLTDVCSNIWNERIHLAASISRLRIKSGALKLQELLPSHLQDDKVAIATANPIVTGWVNPFKINTKNEARELLIEYGFVECQETEDGEVPIRENHFKWDKICPLFLSCIPLDRGQFANSALMKEHQFIMQDRAFALGPAIFSRLLEYFEVEGDVIQTHSSSPRSIAYLAALFRSNYRVNNIIIYGAGARLKEYNEYMQKLGINNIRMRSENFCQLSIHSPALERVVGVFMTPPNSYSAISDPIDLICSRGGDLSMLEVLTESEMSDAGKERVIKILEEQRETLRLGMSRPQVQFILYETHSMVDSENATMVNLAIDSVNKSAHAKHVKLYKEKKRLEALAELEGLNAEQLEKLQGISPGRRKQKQRDEQKKVHESDASSDEDTESDNDVLETSRSRLTATTDDEFSHIKIPKTDIFESVAIPDVCEYQNKCLNLKTAGCYLALIKRRTVTRLDEKHLILMAERRGLFGDTSPKRDKVRVPVKTARKEEKTSTKSPKAKQKKSEDISLLVDRISQPTHSSRTRSQITKKSSFDNKTIIFYPHECDVHSKRHAESYVSEWHDTSYMASMKYTPHTAKQWWTEAVEFIKHLRLQYKVKGEKCIFEMFKDIKRQKVKPLQLTRATSNNDNFELSRPLANTRRLIYPLAANSIEFDNVQRDHCSNREICNSLKHEFRSKISRKKFN